MGTLQAAEQNGAKSKMRGKSTCLFTFRRLKPAFKREEQKKTVKKVFLLGSFLKLRFITTLSK